MDNMFRRHRKGGGTWLYVAGAGSLAFLRAATAKPTSPSSYVTTSGPDPAGLAVVFAVFSGLPATIGLGKLVRFSEAKQSALDDAYRAGKPLPRRVVRRLRKADF